MGKKGGWFSSVRKALSPLSKEKNGQKAKSKKNNQTKNDNTDAVTSHEPVTSSIPPPSLPPSLPHDEAKQNEDNNVTDNNTEQNNHAYSVASATAAAAEVVRLTTIPGFFGKSKDEIAAIKIQTAFRGYLARRALRALRGLVRLKSLVEGQSVKRQAATTLRCMQTLARVQSQIHVRRIRMSEENQALQRQLQQKHESELDKFRMGEEWDDSVLSKEQIEADLQNKQVAAMRRERALAYAFTHQQSRKHKHSNPTFLDPNNPHWGWSWLERWMAARPWESRSVTDNDHSSVKSFRSLSVAGEINRAYALRDFSLYKPSPTAQKSSHPPSRRSPSTPSRTKTKPPSPSPKVNGWGPEDETKSVTSVQLEQFRRHSIGGSTVRDDESLASSPAVPSYMTSTRSAKARNKPPTPSPVGVVEKTNTPNQKLAAGSVKKRLSFPASPGGIRRHSVPGKMESTAVKV